jgi:tetratricopeptide (TPR) repeat protein
MSGANVPPGRFRWRRVARVLVLLALVAVAVWQARVHGSAWDHLKQGRAALRRDDPEDARRHLERVLETWPRSAESHFLAARAARQLGDLDAAMNHLREAERLGHAKPDIDLEHDLILAQSGQLAKVESGLMKCVNDGHADSAQIAAVLVPIYLADFRIVEAERLTARWVEQRPESVKAWTYRADVLERLRRTQEAVDALRELVKLVPEDRSARLNLARMLLETRQAPDEAAGHLEWLLEADPNNPAVLIQLAACREAQGRVDEAAGILDRVIAGPTRAPQAFHYRGRLELNRGRPAAAAPFLRQALELSPSEPGLLYTHFRYLQQTGTPAEIREAEERWRRCEADLTRVGELARAISASPQDPDLRREIGELFLRHGKTQDGVRWLESALRIRPDHAPTHRVLASHYQRNGRPDLAAYHNSLAATKPKTDQNK